MSDPKTNAGDAEVQQPAVSTKRQFTATVATTAVSVVLGIAANYAISKLAGRVHDQIVPTTKTTDE